MKLVFRFGVMVLLVAGCGRWGFTENDRPDAAAAVDGGEPTPEICENSSWDTLTFPDPDVDLAVVDDGSGVTVAWVATAGSDLFAARIGSSWQITGDPAGTLIKPGTWWHTSLAYIDGTLIAAEENQDLSDLKIDLVAPDLSPTSELTCPLSQVISKPPMVHAGTDRVSPVANDVNMDVLPFNSTFGAMASQRSVPSEPATAMASVEVGGAAVVVWSTATACHVEELTDMATGVSAQANMPCASPRLATDGQEVVLVYEGPGGIYLSRGSAMQIGPSTATLLVSNATEPRIVHDGQRYWLSYRDVDGTIGFGYLGITGELLPRATGHTVARGAGQLVLVRGEPWVFMAMSGQLSAMRLCIL